VVNLAYLQDSFRVVPLEIYARSANKRHREVRALTEGAEELPHADLLLLSLSEEGTIDAGHRRKIHILPVSQWLL
jgi:hypothetical protein